MNQSTFTEAASRILEKCRQLTADQPDVHWSRHLVAAMLLDESLAGSCLMEAGVTSESWSDTSFFPNGEFKPDVHEGVEQIMDCAVRICRRDACSNGVSTEHLLLALAESETQAANALAQFGVSSAGLGRQLGLPANTISETIPVEEDLKLSTDDKIDVELNAVPSVSERFGPRSQIQRIVDVNLNRVREGLRVLDDYARFVCNNSMATQTIKQIRHDVVSAETQFCRSLSTVASPNDTTNLLSNRDTAGDVGTGITTKQEQFRESVESVVVVNCRRIQEAMRSLEEFGKLQDTNFAARIKQMRYQSYELEKLLNMPAHSESRNKRDSRKNRLAMLAAAQIYVLVSESGCRLPWKDVIESLVEANADVIQLREKHLSDRELLRRACWIADATRDSETLCIVNDRADLAEQADADGVHIGQDDADIQSVRSILDPSRLVGMSTHNIEQLIDAQHHGTDYVGIGPIFPSTTKTFEGFPGTAFLQQTESELTVPGFAIGGINSSNVEQVLSSGGKRIAVSAAVIASELPTESLTELRQLMNSSHVHTSTRSSDSQAS